MGIVPGTNISAGAKLMRGSWNARPYGPLYDLQVEGVENGTDLYFNKSTSMLPFTTPLPLPNRAQQGQSLFQKEEVQ
jgi:hypothetical protein